MNLDFLRNRKIGLLAIIGPVIALGSIAICVILSPWFSWQNNAISDFGVHNDVALLFNLSLIICGILCSIFALGVIIAFSHRLEKFGMFLVFMASIALVGIGVFTEDYSPWHFYFSVAFFVLLLLACLVMGTYFLKKKSTIYLGIAALAVAIIGIIGWATYEGPGIAIPEALTFVPGGIWFMMLGHWFYKKLND
jgi:hypothetical membrane protein